MTDDPEQYMELLLKWKGTNYTERLSRDLGFRGCVKKALAYSKRAEK